MILQTKGNKYRNSRNEIEVKVVFEYKTVITVKNKKINRRD